MKHIDDIRALIHTLQESTKFHALIIQSPPGWAKSTTVEQALVEMAIPFQMLGAYSTPLQLYNAVFVHSTSTIVIDDCAGLFGQSAAMAILKAATWPSAGGNGARIIGWRSGSDRVLGPEVDFKGKLILLTNSIPSSPDTEALLSRALYLSMDFNPEEIEEMLLAAANRKEYYEDTELAVKVASQLIKNFAGRDNTKLNLRSLQVGCELAKLNPENWRGLLERLMPQSTAVNLVKTLNQSPLSVETQANRFNKMTGLSRRTFFTYRRELGIRKKNAF